MFYILFQKIEGKGALSKSFYKASIIPIPKPDKNSTKSNLHPISLKNLDAELPW